MLRGFITRYYDENDPPQGGGAGDDPPAGEGGKVRASDLRTQLGQTVSEQDVMRILEKQADLLSDNHKLRERVRKLRDVPANAVVLSGDDATAWEAYVALGKPDEVKQQIAAKGEAEQQLKTLQRDATLRDVREVTGYDLDVLRDIGGSDWQYSIKEEQGEGDETHKVVYVKDGDKEVRIDQYPKVQRVLPALRPSSTTEQAQGGTAYPRQSSGGSSPARNAGADHVKKTKYAVPGKTG
jgi:hypothetical protein